MQTACSSRFLLAALADEAQNLVTVVTAVRGHLGGTQARSAIGLDLDDGFQFWSQFVLVCVVIPIGFGLVKGEDLRA